MGKETAEAKRTKANELIVAGNFGISGQVLAEFYTSVTRKSAVPLATGEAWQWIERLSLEPCVAIDAALVRLGIAAAHRYKIGYWDGAIVAAAQLLGATTLFTEDLNHGQLYGSVRVANPFIS